MESVGEYAFDYCSIKTLENFKSLKCIDEGAFLDNNIEEIDIKPSTINSYAFAHCLKLKKVIFLSPDLISLPIGLFESSNIEYIDMKQTSIFEIPERMFQGSTLRKIELPQTLISIG